MTQETAQTAAQPLAPLVPAPLPGEDYIDLPTRLRRLAQAAPDAPCLTAEGQRLTRAEFVARMQQGAGLLQARGIGPGDVVATVFHSLGFDHEAHLPGPAGRPFPLVDLGTQPIKELF